MPDHFYVYPSYLRKRTLRRTGRRVPAALALAEVTAQEIAEAAGRLGYRAEVEPSKNYPREAHLAEGRVRIAKRAGASKPAARRQIAESPRAARGAGDAGESR